AGGRALVHVGRPDRRRGRRRLGRLLRGDALRRAVGDAPDDLDAVSAPEHCGPAALPAVAPIPKRDRRGLFQRSGAGSGAGSAGRIVPPKLERLNVAPVSLSAANTPASDASVTVITASVARHERNAMIRTSMTAATAPSSTRARARNDACCSA